MSNQAGRAARVPWLGSARRFALAAVSAFALAAPTALVAQRPEPPPPSRAEELLAVGRLALAERELYAAAAAQPREPAHRGALGRYLASRGRFIIAEVLFLEALRFGADTASVARALAAMEPYRPIAERRPIPGVRRPTAVRAREQSRASRGGVETIDGPEVSVPMQMTEDGNTLARFRARGAREGDSVWVTLDPSREGIAVSSADDSVLAMQAFGGHGSGTPVLIEELWIGVRRLAWLDAYVDQSVPAGEVRIGLDLLWRMRAIVDERRPEPVLTLPFAGARVMVAPRAFHLPVVLRFPGLWLVPQPGVEPFLLQSPRGRAYLRRARWQIDPATSTLVVER